MIERSHPAVGDLLLERLRHNRLVMALVDWLVRLIGPEPAADADIAWEDGEPHDGDAETGPPR